MSQALRQDNHALHIDQDDITAPVLLEPYNIAGANGYSVTCKLTDVAGGAGSIQLLAGQSKDNLIAITGAVGVIAFSAGEQKMLFNIVSPMYKYVQVSILHTGGSFQADIFITVVEETA